MSITPEVAFAAWSAFLLPTEGGFSNDPADPGNWTGGKCGIGCLKGSKYGISAAAHPACDIPALTLGQANALRKSEYWDKVSGDRVAAVSPGMAFLLADAGYGSGPMTAVEEFQMMLRVDPDGVIGSVTIGALATVIGLPSAYTLPSGLDDVLTEYCSRRLLFEARLRNWDDAQGGWTRRLFHSLVIARSLG